LREVEHRANGILFRILYNPLLSDGELNGWLETSAYAWDEENSITHSPMVIALLLTILLSLAGGVFLSRRALSPVSNLRKAAESISAADLTVRLPTRDGQRDELSDLTDTFNKLLDRVEAAFEREKAFTSDAAHEMLNPLSIITTETELALRKNRSADVLTASVKLINQASTRLSILLSNMLLLARLQDQPGTSRQTGDLATLLSEWNTRAKEQECALEYDIPAAFPISEFPLDILTALRVLVDNAFKYLGDGSCINVRVRENGQHVKIDVEDDGIGLSEDELTRVFDRFFRSSRGAVMAQPGSGLGLAIAKAAVLRCNGSIEIKSEGPGLGTTVCIRIPLGPVFDQGM
jgi:signal transduction histidine kinase